MRKFRSFCRTGPWRPRCCDVAQLGLPVLEFNNGVNPCIHYAGTVQSLAAPRWASPPACWLSRGFHAGLCRRDEARRLNIGASITSSPLTRRHRDKASGTFFSKGIITAEGHRPEFRPGSQGILKAPLKFTLAPTSKTLYKTLPPPLAGAAPAAPSDTKPPPFATLAAATAEGQSLPAGDLPLLTSGATGLPDRATRYPHPQRQHSAKRSIPADPGRLLR